jgi:endonuclease G
MINVQKLITFTFIENKKLIVTRFFGFVALSISLVPTSANAAQTECAMHYAFGDAPEIVNLNMKKYARELCFSGFSVMHSGITRTPLWSAEHITPVSLEQARSMKRVDSFHEETRLPKNERAELSDYSKSGWDRGHQFPNGDAANTEIQHDSFTLANIIPQDPNNNRNLWEGIESSVRTFTKENGHLYVITGPLFIGEDIKLLNGRVMVPTKIYKIVYDQNRNQAAAYLANNSPGMNYEVISIAELEKISGINFFPRMKTSVKNSKMDLPIPKPHSKSSFSNDEIIVNKYHLPSPDAVSKKFNSMLRKVID